MASTVISQVQITNTTSSFIRFVQPHDYHGKVKTAYPDPIPPSQKPVQFVHSGSDQSMGAVVYRYKNEKGEECDWMMSWSNKYEDMSGKVYTEIKEKGHYDSGDVWLDIEKTLEASGKQCEVAWNNLNAIVDVAPGVANDASATFRAMIQPYQKVST